MIPTLESLRARSVRGGIKRQFTQDVIAAQAMVQFSREHDNIRGVLQDYGEFNSMFVINNSDAIIAVDLDFTSQKRTVIPAHSMMNIDQVSYIEFTVNNISPATATAYGEVVIMAINERPLAREDR